MDDPTVPLILGRQSSVNVAAAGESSPGAGALASSEFHTVVRRQWPAPCHRRKSRYEGAPKITQLGYRTWRSFREQRLDRQGRPNGNLGGFLGIRIETSGRGYLS